jgi:hypothetical protein
VGGLLLESADKLVHAGAELIMLPGQHRPRGDRYSARAIARAVDSYS